MHNFEKWAAAYSGKADFKGETVCSLNCNRKPNKTTRALVCQENKHWFCWRQLSEKFPNVFTDKVLEILIGRDSFTLDCFACSGENFNLRKFIAGAFSSAVWTELGVDSNVEFAEDDADPDPFPFVPSIAVTSPSGTSTTEETAEPILSDYQQRQADETERKRQAAIVRNDRLIARNLEKIQLETKQRQEAAQDEADALADGVEPNAEEQPESGISPFTDAECSKSTQFQ